jgi:6-phosphogluconolactonase (cycloisomerase 2 family)
MTASINAIARKFVFSLGLIVLPLAALAEKAVVYTMSNAASGNRVLVFSRNDNGRLKADGSYPTGGLGTGASLGSQGALALTSDNRWLLAVNAASSELSVFSISDDVLVLSDVVPSGGRQPISVTVDGNLVYVLNAGGAVGESDNISGFFLSNEGRLLAIPGSARSLSAANVGPAQVSFALSGNELVVTEKATSRIDRFAVDDNGLAGPLKSSASSGGTPFGFAVNGAQIFVSEAAGGPAGSSALSSYQIYPDGSLNVITGSLGTKQNAACWVVLGKNGRYAFTANAASNTISAFKVANNGALSLLDNTGITAATDNHPTDMTTADHGEFLYVANANSGTIVGFRVNSAGGLQRITDVSGVPSGAAGLIAR